MKLEIGNVSSAIIQLQKAQAAYPLKSLAELVENGIDSGATKIEVIRCRRQKNIEIIINDNGRGITPGPDGNCDMHRIRTNICNSEKIRLKEEERERLHIIGEFGIGVLGFPAIGENLEMLSWTNTSTVTRSMELKAFSDECKISSLTIPMNVGTKVRVWPIHEKIAQRFAGERVSKYLGGELALRLRESQTVITIIDNITKKTFIVKPLDYKGERIPIQELRLSEDRKIKLNLHITQQGETGVVSLIRQGTKVLDNIAKIEELDHAPWNNPMLEGMISNRFVSPTPGRTNLLFDNNFFEFIDAMKTIESKVNEYLREAEEKRSRKINHELHTRLKNTLSSVMAELSSDYIWFNEKGNIPISKNSIIHDKDSVIISGKKKFFIIAEGPLSYIQITPSNYSAVFGETLKLSATAWTKQGYKIIKHVKYEWRLSPPFLGDTRISNEFIEFIAGDESGTVEVHVKATLEYGGKKDTAKKVAHIIIDKKSHKKATAAGFLNPIPVDKPGEKWRSKLMELGLEYNIGHPDYKRAAKGGKNNLFRYLFMIYAKHIVLHSFSGQGEEIVSERMIEIINIFDNKGNDR